MGENLKQISKLPFKGISENAILEKMNAWLEKDKLKTESGKITACKFHDN